jgi:hypothetical protein
MLKQRVNGHGWDAPGCESAASQAVGQICFAGLDAEETGGSEVPPGESVQDLLVPEPKVLEQGERTVVLQVGVARRDGQPTNTPGGCCSATTETQCKAASDKPQVLRPTLLSPASAGTNGLRLWA